MFKRLALLTLVLFSVTGCSISALKKRLDSEELNHYRALRVYLDGPDSRGKRAKIERKEYLNLKTRPERDQWLKDKELWDKFYKYPPHIRQKIIEGAVQVGWERHMVYQSWGHPYSRKKLPGRKASRSELLIYRFEQLKDGTIQLWVPGSKTEYKAARLFTQELFVDDDKVTEMQQKNKGW
jgi:hypothetical protein